jgi:hypothetical protein
MTTVKPLEWTEEKLAWNATGPIVPVAHTALGRYAITELMIGSPAVLKYWVSLSLGAANVGGFDTLEAAKSAAFADYSARIMSAIEPAGVGVETASPSAHLDASSNLLTCPFCGSEPRVWVDDVTLVACSQEDCPGHRADALVLDWNSRTPSPQPRASVLVSLEGGEQ